MPHENEKHAGRVGKRRRVHAPREQERGTSAEIVTWRDVPGVAVTRTALIISEDLPREVWRVVFDQFVRVERGVQFWLGDLLVFAGTHYGRTYVRAVKATGYSRGHL